MSAFLYRLGRACYRSRGRVLAGWLAALVLMGGAAVVLHKSFDDGFSIPGASSQTALKQLQMTFPEAAGTTATMIVVAPKGQHIDDQAIKTAVEAAEQRFADLDFIDATVSPYNATVKGIVTPDRTAGLMTVRTAKGLSEITDDNRAAMVRIADDLHTQLPGADIRMGGEMFSAKMPHVSIIEMLGVGVALVVLLATLGSIIAAGMPLMTAGVGVGISMAILMGMTGLVKISSTTPMLALMLGLAVGIDYALFIVSRHRDQLGTGMDPEESAARSVGTAGSAVVFAGLTVIVALLGLYLVNIPFLATMGAFASVAVAVAVLIALTLVPALMGFARGRLRPRSGQDKQGVLADGDGAEPTPKDTPQTPSQWWVRVVTKIPALTIAIVIAVLGGLAIPAKDMHLALPTSGQHSVKDRDRQTYDLIAEKFGPGYNGQLVVTATLVTLTDPLAVMAGLKSEIEKLDGVASVALATPNRNADTGIVQVIPKYGPDDTRTKKLVADLRAQAGSWRERYHTDTAVTGFTAVAIDVSDRLGEALLPFGLFVVGLSIILLMCVFRSVLVPIKAALGYLLSVGAAMGATTLAFNRGIGRQAINLEAAVPIISFFPIMLMGILFGLAMDYEVFLVSRMREEHVHGTSAKQAVLDGFVHSAKVVVAAALIMFAVFAFFVPNGDGPIKPIAFGLAVGVAFDAFLVRMTLVPAVMALLGEKAWWLPRWLERVLPSFDIEGEALAHQVALANWPSPHSQYLIYAEGLSAGPISQPLYGPVDVALEPGEVLLVRGTPRATDALLLTLAGRLRPTCGDAKVLGKVLTSQRSEIRRAVRYLDHHTRRPTAHLRSSAKVLVMDNLDMLGFDPAEFRQWASRQCDKALVVCFTDPSRAHEFLPAHHVLDLSVGATARPRPVAFEGAAHVLP